MGRLSGRVAMVTGAAMGNGKGGAEAYARHGAQVVLCDVSPKVFETEKELTALGYTVSAKLFDVRDSMACLQAADEVMAECGKIDILLNNAGVCKLFPFVDFTDDMRDFHIDVNIKGIWNMAKAVFPQMIKADYGRIVNMSSVTGPMVVDSGGTAYALTKAAIWGFTKALAYEGAEHHITVNAICPGYVRTPMAEDVARMSRPDDVEGAIKNMCTAIPMKRMCTIRELGDLAVFLSSDESTYITGTQVVIDGGSTLPETFGVFGV